MTRPTNARSRAEGGRRGSIPRRRWAAVLIVAGLWIDGQPRALGGPAPEEGAEPARVASRSGGTVAGTAAEPRSRTAVVDPAISDPAAAALDAIARCQRRFAEIKDYRCKFIKRERIGDTLNPPHIMQMKVRTSPKSVYFKFDYPNKGREAIYVEGRNKGRVVAHDVGFFKVLAGTMNLDPNGSTAMEDCRHPITEAGIGSLIESVAYHWDKELGSKDARITFKSGLNFGGRPVTMIESVHPFKRPEFKHHMVRLYIDHGHGIPVRIESYDWPKHPGAAGELLEEYSYIDIAVNPGLTDSDFDPSNRSYAFGRF